MHTVTFCSCVGYELTTFVELLQPEICCEKSAHKEKSETTSANYRKSWDPQTQEVDLPPTTKDWWFYLHRQHPSQETLGKCDVWCVVWWDPANGSCVVLLPTHCKYCNQLERRSTYVTENYRYLWNNVVHPWCDNNHLLASRGCCLMEQHVQFTTRIKVITWRSIWCTMLHYSNSQ